MGIEQSRAGRQRRFPWHICGCCYFIDPDNMCCYYPDQTPVLPDRWGCFFWECAGCNGPYDEVDSKNQLVDHVSCMHGVIEIC